MYLELVVLALLVEKPRYGYEIKKYIEQRYDSVTEVNTNTIYPILRKFVDKGFTQKETIIEEGKPNRIVYTITAKGRKETVNKLRNFPDSILYEFDECMIRLVYFDWMDERSRTRLIEGREKRILETQKEIEKITDFQWTHPLVIDYGEKSRAIELKMITEFKKLIHSPCYMDEEGNILSDE